jgi:hypothetical protein
VYIKVTLWGGKRFIEELVQDKRSLNDKKADAGPYLQVEGHGGPVHAREVFELDVVSLP